MTDTFIQTTDSTDQSQTDTKEQKKQRKKLAKKEAKLMLKLEEARKDIQKAEQKLAKAQARLDEYYQQIQSLEEELRQLRSSTQTEDNYVEATSQEQGDNQNNSVDIEETITILISTEAENEEPPVETRYGLFAEQDALQAESVDETSLSATTADPDQSQDSVASAEGQSIIEAKSGDELDSSITAFVSDEQNSQPDASAGESIHDPSILMPPAEGRDDILPQTDTVNDQAAEDKQSAYASDSSADAVTTSEQIASEEVSQASPQTPENQLVEIPPAEGRSDILPEDTATRDQGTTEQSTALQSESNHADHTTAEDGDEADDSSEDHSSSEDAHPEGATQPKRRSRRRREHHEA